MFARVLFAASVICLSTAVPIAKPSEKVCQTLSTSCQDLWVASSCKTVKPCIEMIWEKLEVPMDKSGVCNICKEMVKEARDQLLSNETQEELREVLEGSCALIPIGFISEMCKEVVDSFIPDLIDILVSRMDPDQVCTIAGLCNPDFVTRKLQNLLQHKVFIASVQSRIFLPLTKEVSALSTKKEATCTQCKTAMKYARELFQKLPLEGVKSAVLKVCHERLGTANPECSTLVNVFLPSVFKYLQSLDPEEFCAYVDRCKSVNPPKLSIPSLTKANDDLTCDFCKQLVEHVRQMFASNTTEDEFKQALLNFCEELGSAAEECQSLVEKYYDTVYTYFLDALDPDAFCHTIGLCTTSGMKSEEKALNKIFIKAMHGALQQKGHLKNLKAAKKVKGYLEPQHSVPLIKVYPALPKKYFDNNQSDITFPMVKTFPAQQNTRVDDIYTCSICKAFVTLLEQVIPMNATVEDVKFVLDQICELFPTETERNCRSFVDKNAAVILKFLANDVAPAVICHEITLCSSLPPKNIGAVSDSPDCDYCKLTVEFFYDELKKRETEEEIKLIVEKVCQLFPSSSRDKCISTINTYVDMVISLVLQEFTPEQICQQLGFCAATIKSTPVIPPKKVSDDTCDLCMVVAKFVYDKVKDERTEEKVKEALDQVCSLLPSSLEQKCVEMVNNYYDMLVSLLVQELVPDEVCKELGLCPSSDVPSKKPTDEECDICKIVVKFVYNELQDNKTEEQVKNLLDKVCSLLPDSLKQTCADTVNTYYDELVELIVKGFTPEQVCQELGLCPSAKKAGMPPVASVPSKKARDDVCDICKVVVKFVYDELQDNKTEEEVKKLLDKVCSVLPESLKQTCTDTVNTYYDQLVQLIVQGFTPEEICEELGLCTSAKKAGMPSVASVPSKKARDDVCDICKVVVKFVYDELQDNKTEEEVKKLLDKVCSVLPESLRQTCTDTVNTYYDQLVQLIVQGFTPEEICEELGLCTSALKKPVATRPAKVANDEECTYCTTIVQYVYDALQDEKTEEEIKEVLDEVCNLFHGDRRQQCVNMVNTYFEIIVALVLQDFTPQQICETIGMCQSSTGRDIECTFCQYALHFIQNELVENNTEARVEAVLDKLCSKLPNDLAKECMAFVEEYGPAVMVLLAQEIDPSIVCVAIKVCPKDGLQKQSDMKLKLSECATCKAATSYVEKILKDTKNDQEAAKQLANACDHAPKALQSQCKALIKTYGPALLQTIAQVGSGEKACKKLDICSNDAEPHKHRQLKLGSNPCTRGPAHWCHSKENAAACKATQFCQKKVWKQ
ncbi:uncharacterized protein LOC119398702 isoform X2 [Rhipicephalus sanguineus]|uniref:uncharacterized protein LOC119398702 isoform X2 n=1 Tax=Rhipicephalus sanguineus TaxID=34632 RepID=UPI0020C36272|nr:uncharacterized protein LOC119398702 isoform X2 [Rhipicephalus sanguineus]